MWWWLSVFRLILNKFQILHHHYFQREDQFYKSLYTNNVNNVLRQKTYFVSLGTLATRSRYREYKIKCHMSSLVYLFRFPFPTLGVDSHYQKVQAMMTGKGHALILLFIGTPYKACVTPSWCFTLVKFNSVLFIEITTQVCHLMSLTTPHFRLNMAQTQAFWNSNKKSKVRVRLLHRAFRYRWCHFYENNNFFQIVSQLCHKLLTIVADTHRLTDTLHTETPKSHHKRLFFSF